MNISGKSHLYIRIGDEGSRILFNFCPECGATVYYTIEGHEERIAIPVGAFSDPTFPAPTFSVYEDRMHTWVKLPKGINHMA